MFRLRKIPILIIKMSLLLLFIPSIGYSDYLKDILLNSSKIKNKAEKIKEMGEPAIMSLVSILDDKTESNRTRGFAAKVLEELADARTVLSLIDIFERGEPQSQVNASNILKKIGSPAVLPLIDILESSHDYTLTARSAELLGDLGDPRAFEPILNILEEYLLELGRELPDKPEFKRPNMPAYEVEVVTVEFKDGATQEVIGEVDVQVVSLKDSYIRADNRARKRHNNALQDRREELQEMRDQESKARRVVSTAKMALNMITGKSFGADVEKWESYWDKKGPGILRDNEIKLRKANSRTYSPEEIKKMIDEKNWNMLSLVGQPAEEHLISALMSKESSIRSGAVETLARIGSEDSIEAIPPLLKDKDKKVKKAAVEALLERGKGAILKPLFPILIKDKDKWLRIAIARRLGEIGSKNAVKPLIITLKDKDPSVVNQSAKSLEQLTGEKHGKSYKKWVRWWQTVVADKKKPAKKEIGATEK